MAQSNKNDSAPVEGQWYSEMHYKEKWFQTEVMQCVLFHFHKFLKIEKTDQ